MTPAMELEIERRVAAYRASLEKRAESGVLGKPARPRQDEAKALFNAGLSKRQIAEKMGIGVTMAGVHLANAGCVKKRKPNLSHAEVKKRNDAIWKEFTAGSSRKELANRYGVSGGNLSSIISTARRWDASQKRRRAVLEAHEEGASRDEIARRFDMPKYKVVWILESVARAGGGHTLV